MKAAIVSPPPAVVVPSGSRGRAPHPPVPELRSRGAPPQLRAAGALLPSFLPSSFRPQRSAPRRPHCRSRATAPPPGFIGG